MKQGVHGNFFEDFPVGQELVHAVPRTITTGMSHSIPRSMACASPCNRPTRFAQSCGCRAPRSTICLLFHVIFGKTVPDVSLNAVANLGYAECRFLEPAWPGRQFHGAQHGDRPAENANGKTGIVYVRPVGYNQQASRLRASFDGSW